MRMTFTTLAVLALLAAGCDPEAPVESSDVEAEIDAKIALHASNSSTHGNLLVPAANVSGQFDGSQIEDGAIGISHLASSSVGSDEIADQSISAIDMGAGSVGAVQLANDAVTTEKIAANTIGAADIAAGAIAGGVLGAIADNSINTADVENASLLGVDLANNTLTGVQIMDDVLDDGDIVDDGIDATSLAADSVTASELANNAVDTNAIANANVTTAKIADGAITVGQKVNLGTLGQIQDADAAMFNTAVFNFTEDNAENREVRIVGACESDVAGSEIRLTDDNDAVTAACPDTNLNGPPALFDLLVVANDANGDEVTVLVNAGANNGFVRWRVFSITITNL